MTLWLFEFFFEKFLFDFLREKSLFDFLSFFFEKLLFDFLREKWLLDFLFFFRKVTFWLFARKVTFWLFDFLREKWLFDFLSCFSKSYFLTFCAKSDFLTFWVFFRNVTFWPFCAKSDFLTFCAKSDFLTFWAVFSKSYFLTFCAKSDFLTFWVVFRKVTFWLFARKVTFWLFEFFFEKLLFDFLRDKLLFDFLTFCAKSAYSRSKAFLRRERRLVYLEIPTIDGGVRVWMNLVCIPCFIDFAFSERQPRKETDPLNKLGFRVVQDCGLRELRTGGSNMVRKPLCSLYLQTNFETLLVSIYTINLTIYLLFSWVSCQGETDIWRLIKELPTCLPFVGLFHVVSQGSKSFRGQESMFSKLWLSNVFQVSNSIIRNYPPTH